MRENVNVEQKPGKVFLLDPHETFHSHRNIARVSSLSLVEYM